MRTREKKKKKLKKISIGLHILIYRVAIVIELYYTYILKY